MSAARRPATLLVIPSRPCSPALLQGGVKPQEAACHRLSLSVPPDQLMPHLTNLSVPCRNLQLLTCRHRLCSADSCSLSVRLAEPRLDKGQICPFHVVYPFLEQNFQPVHAHALPCARRLRVAGGLQSQQLGAHATSLQLAPSMATAAATVTMATPTVPLPLGPVELAQPVVIHH